MTARLSRRLFGAPARRVAARGSRHQAPSVARCDSRSNRGIRNAACAAALIASVAGVIGCGTSSDDDDRASNPRQPTDTRVEDEAAPSADLQALINQALSIDPRRPGDIDLFSSVYQPSGAEGLYPNGSAMATAGGPAPSEQQVRDQMPVFLGAWYNDDSAKVDAAMRRFDDAQVKTMIPDAALRAAFVSLGATIWEPQVEYFLNSGRFIPARYGGLPNTVFARSALTGGRATIVFNARHTAEHFSRQIPQWVHEIGHDDGPSSRDEEATLHALQAMAWGQVLHGSPGSAYEDTELTRVMNGYILRLLNSRERGRPSIAILARSGLGTAPGSPSDAPDFASAITEPANTRITPAPSSVLQILGDLGVGGTEYGPALNEGFKAVNGTWLDDRARVHLSVLLQMTTPAAIAEASGVAEQDVIDRLDLRRFSRCNQVTPIDG